jgi:hypothetical protein
MSVHAIADHRDSLPGMELVPLGPAFSLTEHSLSAPMGVDPSIEQCGEAAQRLKTIFGAIAYWMGDLINLTERLHGEQASQVIDAGFLDEKLTADFRFVAQQVGVPLRAIAPSWDHARAVARLKPAQQEKWLQKALDEDWIVSKLKSEISAAEAGGSQALRFLVIVDAHTEAKQKALAAELEKQGYPCTLRSGLKREVKEKRARKAKGGIRKGGAKRRGAPKPYARRKGAAKA